MEDFLTYFSRKAAQGNLVSLAHYEAAAKLNRSLHLHVQLYCRGEIKRDLFIKGLNALYEATK